jgi:isomerase DpgB
MVNDEREVGRMSLSETPAATEEFVLRIDGSAPLSTRVIGVVTAVCDRVEDGAGPARVVVHVSGTPSGPWAGDLTVALVGKWERALRRLERLPAPTFAVAEGDCGGTALDALLATDYRIATGSVQLHLPVFGGTVWPGMAIYRLASQAVNNVGIRRAILFGMPIGAQQARELGLVEEVTENVVGALERAGGNASTLVGRELAVRRQLLLDASTVSFEDALGTHLAACDLTLRRTSGAVAV